MAKGKSPGGGNLDEQIAKLEISLKPKERKEAKEIADSYSVDVVKLAFRYVRKRQIDAGGGGLGKRIEDMLAQVPAGERDAMRTALTKAKAKAANA